MAVDGTNNELRERPIGDLLKQLSQETTTLVKQELDLAKEEVAQKGQQAGKGAGMFGGAGAVGFLARAALNAARIMASDRAWPNRAGEVIVAEVTAHTA